MSDNVQISGIESWSVQLGSERQTVMLTINNVAIEMPCQTAEAIGKALQSRALETASRTSSGTTTDQRKH